VAGDEDNRGALFQWPVPVRRLQEKEEAPPARPGIEAGTSVAGLIGAAIVLGMVLLIGMGIRSFRRRST